MQVIVEGLALAAFAAIRDTAQHPLAAAVNANVVEDEAHARSLEARHRQISATIAAGRT
jgi:hypothetical protein